MACETHLDTKPQERFAYTRCEKCDKWRPLTAEEKKKEAKRG